MVLRVGRWDCGIVRVNHAYSRAKGGGTGDALSKTRERKSKMTK